MHDVCAIVPYVAPDVAPGLIRYVETSVKVELAGMYTRGMTVCDLRGVRPGAMTGIGAAGPATVKVAVEADRRALVDLVTDAVLSFE
jgi:inosine-uridine nucleoside N-ribohydrolase